MHTYLEFEVSLLDIEPRIWRRFQLGADDTFGDLHLAIQDSLDWDKDHMWIFRTAGRDRRTLAGPGAFDLGYESDEIPDAWDVKLTQHFRRVSMACRYTYDFGDNWVHAVKLRQRVDERGAIPTPPCRRQSCRPQGRQRGDLRILASGREVRDR